MSRKTVVSYAIFYAGWWLCALGAMSHKLWLAPTTVVVALIIYPILMPITRSDIGFALATGLFGCGLDSLLHAIDLFRFPDHIGPFIPLWLTCLWILFGITFESLSYLRRQSRWILWAASGVGGPLAYLWGAWAHIVIYDKPYPLTVGLHMLIWAPLLPLFFHLKDKWFTSEEAAYREPS